jgi:glycosyltransferase involved in cell wall biosynthesis
MAAKKVLIFIVAYNAESTIQSVLTRIPLELLQSFDYEILIVDDESHDRTFELASEFKKTHPQYKLTVLFNPLNQGYGGNQKVGYEYAIQNGFDAVALLHGDGQYAPEMLGTLIEPILAGEADAVFGSRMMQPRNALKGGMPFYKFVGNRILTKIQNRLLHSNLSEFHSGYRVYSVPALASIPFRYNTNNFHFDTEIIIQFMLKKLRIKEIAIPTYYGDEICRVNGIAYAFNVVKSTILSRLQQMEILYRRNFDVFPREDRYRLKLGYVSSDTMAMDHIPPNARVLDLGCRKGLWGSELKRSKNCYISGVDSIEPPGGHALDAFRKTDLNSERLLVPTDDFDYVVLLDVLEHLDFPAQTRILNDIRELAIKKKPALILTTSNIAFLFTRLLLMMGQFNYSRRGILDYTHRHLFTFSSFKNLLIQSGYQVEKMRGIPPPYPEALGDNWFSRTMLWMHKAAVAVFPRIFAYQIFVVARPTSTVPQLLNNALVTSRKKSQRLLRVEEHAEVNE